MAPWCYTNLYIIISLLLFTASTDLGYRRFIVANEKFIKLLELPQNRMPQGPHW